MSFPDEAVKGALEGTPCSKNKDNLSMLDKINDFEWLEEQWKA